MINSPLVMIGAGGHAAVCFDVLVKNQQNKNLLGVITPDIEAGSYWQPLNLVSLGNDQSGLALINSNDSIGFINGCGFLPRNSLRYRLYQEYKSKGASFTTLIHPSAIVSHYANLSEGVQVMAGACLQIGCDINQNTIINTRAVVEHHVSIGAHCHIAPGSIICGDTVVKDHVFIGTGAVILQGITIGTGAIIGAGVTVKSDVAEKAILK
ncbi:NeuD/PglB/VioB family sugar acetyltransferase [Pleionea mediterranea]|nr:NeuD/PglB/VioB family sugar acetyltransferase [Pleionea mediterranea]